MFYNLIKPSEGEEAEEMDDDSQEENIGMQLIDKDTQKKKQKSLKLSERGKKIRNKIKFVSKMLKMQKILREQNETIIKIKNQNNNKLPKGILLEGTKALAAFHEAKNKDIRNEKRPDK